MAAKLKVDQIETVAGSGTLTINNDVAMAATKTLPAASLTGALPAISGANLTNLPAPADNSITLAKMASGTDGNIISYDASGDPVAIATGTDGQVLTSTGAGSPPAFEDAAAAGGLQSMQVFTSSGTWTKPAGITKVRVFCTGGGGGGGGGTGSFNAGGGGGAGGTSIDLDDCTGYSSITVTVGGAGSAGAAGATGGAGGTSSFGSVCSATGGYAGTYGWHNTNSVYGVGGVGSSGDINLHGGDGGMEGGGELTDESSQGNDGGASYWGGGGQGGGAGNSEHANKYTGQVGKAYGSGGGGGDHNNTNGSFPGGAGKAGIILVEEYA